LKTTNKPHCGSLETDWRGAGERNSMKKIICQYCSNEAKEVTGKEIYPHRKDLYNLKFYQCEPCNAYVGCHRKSGVPFGTLANANTRKARNKAHAHFDKFWKGRKMDRKDCYILLSHFMGISVKKTHIGNFNVEQCGMVLEFKPDITKLSALKDEKSVDVNGVITIK
jgi:hypothetical protein